MTVGVDQGIVLRQLFPAGIGNILAFVREAIDPARTNLLCYKQFERPAC